MSETQDSLWILYASNHSAKTPNISMACGNNGDYLIATPLMANILPNIDHGYVDPKRTRNYKYPNTKYDDDDDEYIRKDDKYDTRYLTKYRIGLDKKSASFKVSNLKDDREDDMEDDRKDDREDDSRGRLNRRRGQERPGKMIHDRTNEKILLIPQPREGWKEIKKDEKMTPRRKTKKTYRRSEGKRNKTVSVVVPKKGDVFDRQSGWAYRDDGDEEPKFLTNPDKRMNFPERNEANDQMPNLPTREKYDQMGRERSMFNSVFGNGIDDKDRKRTKSRGSKFMESSLTTNEAFTRTNESRYWNKRSITSLSCKNDIGSPNTIEYQLSDEYFVKLGWTVLPIRKFMRKIPLYESKMAKPHLDWFKKCRYENRRYYEDGVTPFLTFHPDTTAELFYPNGRIAVKIDKPENRKYDTYTVFTPGGKDIVGIGRKQKIVAIFDSLGNGIILDENGTTRLSYNQIGGIWKDNPGGLPFLWTWSSNVEEPIVENETSTNELEKLLLAWKKNLESTESTKAPSMREKTEIASANRKPGVITTAAAAVEERKEYLESEYVCNKKLNKYLSFRILDRRNVSLQFFSGARSIRIELGTILDYNKQLTSYYEDMIDGRKATQK
ncbi:hypothetical protein M0802_009175 [Mischocyttarus mexicanus]|nr:hypothetical protein M0802_009175 [Mischocyttarus mexicanus]